MTTPTKESHDPNRGPVSALKRRPPAGGELGPSPSKQRKKVKNDRRTRRVSFAPDPELTMVHHFEKDEFSAHSSDGRPVLSTLAESDGGAPSGDGGYRPGFWDKTVPDGSPLQEPAPLDSPGMVSMEITQPVLAAVHRGFSGSEEEEEAAVAVQQQQQYAPGEVTAGLPSLGALAEADAYEDELLLQQAQLGGSGVGTAGEWQQGAGVDATMNITGGIPGLSSLIAEDEEAEAGGAPMEEATAGMDLTLADGRVLEHAQQLPAEPEQLQPEPEPAAAPAPAGRRSSTGELSKQRVVQANKWGFAPGCEDTLDLNLEMHGRMIMGDTTFNRMYGDTTGETTLRQHAAAAGAEEGVTPQVARGPPAEDVDDILLSPQPSKQQQQQGAAAAGRQAAGQAPNWQAPAFLPPYMQQSNQTATSDHPALVQSPVDSNSTMETRRLSVAGDTRCLSDVKSRRMSMQDATGRLLQDDLDDDLGLDLGPAAQPGLVARRQSHLSAGGRGDITERLLADDEEEELDDGSGPLAGIKRQMRMLSQEQQLEQPYEPALGQQQEQQKAAQTPQRPAHSMGVADSSNPVTMALLRSGGTTRLLQDTVHVRPRQQGQAPQAAAARPAATGGSNGTTKLLADMTMVSMVGAKRQSAGLLAQRRMSVENGLTDYSLDGFDVPPELPAEQQHQQAGQGAQQQWEQQRPSQHGGMAEAAQAQEQGQQHAATPPQPSTSQGYPADLPEEVPAIPGGPKLTRTPVPVRPDVSQQRTQVTPRSVHSTRSHPGQITPASRQQEATPPPSAATYPIPRDDTGLIPGGPKLARTPVSSRQQGQPGYDAPPGTGRPMRTPVTGQRLPPTAPGSAMAQHYPGTGPLPTSAMMVRYPGSAVAAHRLGARGMTPLHQSQSQPLPMTFQDFTKLMDVQFLDNLRRGASINYADMQPNPVPKTAQDAYTLLCSIAPQVNVLENGIRILQELVQERRIKSAESETFIGLHNPSLFGEVQFVDEERLEALKAGVGLLKKLQRQKAVAELKAYRKEMEEDKAHRLVRNLELLQHDREFLEGNEKSMVQLAHAGQQYVAEQQQRMEEELLARQEEAERRERLKCMQASLEEQQSSNAQRRQQLEEVQARVAALKASNAALSSEREAVQSKIEALSQRLTQSQSTAAQQSSPQELLDKSAALDVLSSCTGVRLEQLRQDGGSAELVVRLAGLFQMRVQVSSGAAASTVQLAAGVLPQLSESCRQLVADMAASQGQFQVNLAGAGATNLTAAMQAASARLTSVAELAKELDGLKLGCPSLFDVSCSQGAMQLEFTNLTTEVQFSVVLSLPSSYPQGEMPHELKIRSDGKGHITPAAVAAALAAVPEGRGRIKAVCAALSSLASSAVPAQPFFLRPPSPSSPRATPGMTPRFQNNFSNPLFGGSALRSTVKQLN